VPKCEGFRVLLVDDHHLVRTGIELILKQVNGATVIGSLAEGGVALELAASEAADLILLDVNLKDEDGLDLLLEFKRRSPKSKIIVLTASRDRHLHRKCVEFGAEGLVLKEQSTEVLVQAIEKVLNGQVWFDRDLVWEVLTDMFGPSNRTLGTLEHKINSLTERERLLIEMVSKGSTQETIASQLGVSQRTVRYHMSSLLTKLGLANRSELIAFGVRYRIAQPIQ